MFWGLVPGLDRANGPVCWRAPQPSSVMKGPQACTATTSRNGLRVTVLANPACHDFCPCPSHSLNSARLLGMQLSGPAGPAALESVRLMPHCACRLGPHFTESDCANAVQLIFALQLRCQGGTLPAAHLSACGCEQQREDGFLLETGWPRVKPTTAGCVRRQLIIGHFAEDTAFSPLPS